MGAASKHLLIIVGMCLLTAALFYAIYEHIVPYETFYQYQAKPAGAPFFKILLGVCVCLLTFVALHKSVRPWQFLVIGVAVGTVSQFGFAYTEGRGFEGIRGRALAGHGQFIGAALASDDAGRTLRNYESLAERGKLGQYPQSKPPGTLMFYVLTEHVSRLFVAHTYDELKRKDRFVDFLAVVWPFVAALAILPLYWIATRLAGPDEARLAAALYLLVPSFNLVTLHTDQVLFPFLFVSVLGLFVLCLNSKEGTPLIIRGVATGAALCLAVFCDFPLAVAVVLCFGLWLAAFVTDQRPYSERFRSTATLAGALAAGVIVPSVVLWMVFDYNPVVRWKAALAFHAAWRKVPAIVGLDAGLSNIAEFLDWTGVPISCLALAIFVMGSTTAGAGNRRQTMLYRGLLAGLIAVAGYLAFFSRTVAEIGRLWMFLMPVMCLVASRTLSELRKTQRYAPALVFALQFASVYVIKVTHDFW